MGTSFSITVTAEDSFFAMRALDAGFAEIDRIEAAISSWRPGSETSRVNLEAGRRSVRVSDDLFGLIERSLKVSALTEGAFDITFAALDPVWRFDGTMTRVPDSAAVAVSVVHVGWERIVLDPEARTVFLPDSGMRIGFGAIGKGFAADRVRGLLVGLGVEGGLVNAGGDLSTWGTEADGEPWTVAVADPAHPDEVLAWMDVSNRAVVTSGDYERYAELEGRRYAHILDPRTGWPVAGLRAVTVIGPDAERADALATALFVMGKERGLELAGRLPGFEAFFVDDRGGFAFSPGIEARRTGR